MTEYPPRYIHDLSADEIAVLEPLLRPGGASRQGFLDETESLRDVAARDDRTLESLDVTHAQIADRLESIVGQAYRAQDLALRDAAGDARWEWFTDISADTLIEGRFRVEEWASMGYQECPLCVHESSASLSHEPWSGSVFTIENAGRKQSIRFPGLIVHLIRRHHFFEGSTSYRLDPADAIDVLEIEPDVDYAPVRRREDIWVAQGFSEDVTGAVADVVGRADEQVALGGSARAYVRGDVCVVVAEGRLDIRGARVIGGAVLDRPRISKGVYTYRRDSQEYVGLVRRP